MKQIVLQLDKKLLPEIHGEHYLCGVTVQKGMKLRATGYKLQVPFGT
ncbi:hypothetical protein NXV86_02070 [Bacteroides sp. BFG-257]|nr:hypothetical protein [Bacteroides sp. BFG-257]UVO98857.1 hypothetical protein NXV86_02070 [Bacteroides sp. BFG-257]